MTDSAHIHSFIRARMGASASMEKMAGDASTREYYRVQTGEQTRILCIDTALRGRPLESYPYYIVYGLFRKYGIPVPRVWHFDEKEGLLLIEDLGDASVETLFPVISPPERERIYLALVDIIVKIQSIEKNPALEPFHLSFDAEKLMFEFNFFIEHALGAYFGHSLKEGWVDELRREFLAVSKILDRPDLFVLNHRDYHSRNAMIFHGSPWIIDFQDARMGLPQYDLVSLLRDSYLRLDAGLFTRLKDYYYRISTEAGIHGMSPEEFDYFFDIMAFQRNVKALGTFGFQVSVRGKSGFEKYIGPTISYLKEYVDRRDELKRAGGILSGCFGEVR